MARSYRRDSRGRFSGGGGGGKATGGSLKARSSAKRSQAKLATKDQGDKSLSGSLSRRAQRAAVTRTGKAAAAAKAANRTKLAGGRPTGTVGKAKGAKPAAPAKPQQPRPKTPRQVANTRKTTYRALGILDNTHQDTPTTRAIARFAGGSISKKQDKIERMRQRATRANRSARL